MVLHQHHERLKSATISEDQTLATVILLAAPKRDTFIYR